MPTRRCPPADSAAAMIGRCAAADAGRRPRGHLGRQHRDPGEQRGVVAGIPPGTPVTKSTWTFPPNGRPWASMQPVQRRDVAEVEQLELGHDLALLRLHVEVGHEGLGVEEDVVAEVGRTAGQGARVRVGVEHVSRCSSGSCTYRRWTAGREVGLLAHRVDRARSRPASSVGRWSASRMCRWIIEAPAASQRRAVSTSSSRVVGSCGQSALACSAPVGATVIRVPGPAGTAGAREPCPHHGRTPRICGPQPLTTTVCAAEMPSTRRPVVGRCCA